MDKDLADSNSSQEKTINDIQEKFLSLFDKTFVLKSGEIVRFCQEGATLRAGVESIVGTLKRNLTLPVYVDPAANLEEAMLINHIHLVLPEKDYQRHRGYMYIGKPGLMGGTQNIRIDVDDVWNIVEQGYAQLGRQEAEIFQETWKPLIKQLIEGLQCINLDLSMVDSEAIDSVNPGRIKEIVESLVSAVVARDIKFANYGLAWYRIIAETRKQLKEKQKGALDPAYYPMNAYVIILKPSIDKVRPLIEEVDKLFTTEIGSTVILDASKLLGLLDLIMVDINLAMVDIDLSFSALINAVNEVKAEKKSVEPVPPKGITSEIVVEKIPQKQAMPQHESKEEETEPEERLLLLTSPTGKGMRIDGAGHGKYNASRGGREHKGIDFQIKPDSAVFSPVAGSVINVRGYIQEAVAKAKLHGTKVDKRTLPSPIYDRVEIYPTEAYFKKHFDYIKMLYVGLPEDEEWDEPQKDKREAQRKRGIVERGAIIGKGLNLQTQGYTPDVSSHVHLELIKKGVGNIDPTPFFSPEDLKPSLESARYV